MPLVSKSTLPPVLVTSAGKETDPPLLPNKLTPGPALIVARLVSVSELAVPDMLVPLASSVVPFKFALV